MHIYKGAYLWDSMVCTIVHSKVSTLLQVAELGQMVSDFVPYN